MGRPVDDRSEAAFRRAIGERGDIAVGHAEVTTAWTGQWRRNGKINGWMYITA